MKLICRLKVHNIYNIGLESNLEEKNKILRRIEINLRDLRKTNRKPIFHQYVELSDQVYNVYIYI